MERLELTAIRPCDLSLPEFLGQGVHSERQPLREDERFVKHAEHASGIVVRPESHYFTYVAKVRRRWRPKLASWFDCVSAVRFPY